MSKVAAYLRGHLAGEVVTRQDVRDAMSTDTGVLKIKPEMVIYPKNTNDIRKVARFSWQLAQKGHALPITVRGGGTDATGAAIGKGIALVTTAHMNKIFEYEQKQKLIRLQPGVTIAAASQSLSLAGAAIMSLHSSHAYGTVGGAIASAVTGPLAGKYGTIEKSIDQLEVVLANGDVLQTGRISKRELNRRKGLQGFEGDIYRGIDGIIEEYADVLDTLRANDATGYNTIADVKQKDGSFDLTPLFVGSQGTLGIVTEMIMRAEFRSLHVSAAALVFSNSNAARDALDELCKMAPALIDYVDAELFETAKKAGKVYQWYDDATKDVPAAAVVVVGFDEFNDRHRNKRLKRIIKMFGKSEEVVCITAHGDDADLLLDALSVPHYTTTPDDIEQAAPGVLSGFHVPTERLEDFTIALEALAKKHHVSMPMTGHVFTNTYSVYPSFNLHKVGDKQKVLALLADLTKLVNAHGGTMIAEGGEGRLKAPFVYAELDEKVVKLYQEVRKVCDPFNTLNPGVKAVGEVKELVPMLRSSPDAGQLAHFGVA
ncbi:MAG: FAD-binding oxidoreductase [Candidatus Saccharimonas sp.]